MKYSKSKSSSGSSGESPFATLFSLLCLVYLILTFRKLNKVYNVVASRSSANWKMGWTFGNAQTTMLLAGFGAKYVGIHETKGVFAAAVAAILTGFWFEVHYTGQKEKEPRKKSSVTRVGKAAKEIR